MNLGVLQENLLVLLAYHDEQAKIIRNTVDLGLFGGQYRLIASRIYEYLDRYKKPPGDHLADIMVDKLDGENKREATLYGDVVNSIHEASGGINKEYVMGQLELFVRRQSLRNIAVDLTKLLQRDTEASLDEADTLLRNVNTTSLQLFDMGLRLSDSERVLDFLSHATECLPTGIPELDKRGFGPTRKELWLLVANTKGGKTWSLIHLAKMALLHRYKVLHISLEMSEARVAQRYFQTLFSISKRDEPLNVTKFERDNLGRISGFNDSRIKPSFTLDTPDVSTRLQKLVSKWSGRLLDNIVVKQFPTGSLTVNQLKAYLDNLELTQRFVPDLIVLDYPDLMKLDASNYRVSLDQVYQHLRGIAIERNCALAVVSQSHRDAAKAKQVGAFNVAEAYAKIFHADTIITLSQTAAEQRLGLARLHVAAGRNDSDKFTIVISQQYGVGNFAIDSNLLVGNYWEQLPDGDDTGDAVGN
jgi:hypothetical protein